MRLKLRISTAVRKLRVKIHEYFLLKPAQPPAQQQPKVSKGGGKPIHIDVNECMRLRRLGWSDRKIARKMGVSRGTVGSRLREWKPAPVQPPAAPVQPAPAATYEPPAILPVAPKPVPVPVAPVTPPEPSGLDSIPAGYKAFFLVRGSLNQQYARGYAQPAIGIERWHEEYRNLPAFHAGARIWVVLNAAEDNQAFVLSLVNDIWIREQCVISREGVQTVCKSRMLWERERHSASIVEPAFQRADRSDFEALYQFQPIPQPNHTDKLAALCKQPESDVADPYRRFHHAWEGF